MKLPRYYLFLTFLPFHFSEKYQRYILCFVYLITFITFFRTPHEF